MKVVSESERVALHDSIVSLREKVATVVLSSIGSNHYSKPVCRTWANSEVQWCNDLNRSLRSKKHKQLKALRQYHGLHLSTCTNEPFGEDLCARCEAVIKRHEIWEL